ncbi:MAG: antibiotic biosynthesis monooxygenase [Paucimonas sp.]|nr:antibiotic biosynthesis monooxygenase [Paucimonas sp.]
MILELVDLRIHPGKQDEFDEAIRHGVAETIAKSPGYLGHQINHCIETPERFVLMVYWQTLENHTVDFRGSPAFTAWRAVVGPYFAAAPVVEHFTLLEKAG